MPSFAQMGSASEELFDFAIITHLLTCSTFPFVAFFTEQVIISPIVANLPLVLIHWTSLAPLLSVTVSLLPTISISLSTPQATGSSNYNNPTKVCNKEVKLQSLATPQQKPTPELGSPSMQGAKDPPAALPCGWAFHIPSHPEPLCRTFSLFATFSILTLRQLGFEVLHDGFLVPGGCVPPRRPPGPPHQIGLDVGEVVPKIPPLRTHIA